MGSLYRRKQRIGDGTWRELPTWWLQYQQDGRVVRESSGTAKETVARRILRQREGAIESGLHVSPKTGKVTFEQAAEDVLNDYRINGQDVDKADERLRLHLRPFFKGYRMMSITVPKIRDYVASRRDEGAAIATINRELALLKRMFSLAVEAGLLHTAPKLRKPKEQNTRQGFFEQDAFDAIRSNLPAEIRPVVTFAYLTGWRVPSEVLTRQWKHADLKAQTVRLEPLEAKNDDGRTFPYGILPDLADVITAQWQEHERMKREGTICPWVFHRNGKPIKTFYGAWRTACKAAGYPGRIPHDFRRTAVRNLVRAGVSEKTAMQLTGHKTRSVFDRYDIVNEADLRTAVQKLAGTISGTISKSAGGTT